MLNNAMKEPRYLTTASVNLRSALLYDRLIEHQFISPDTPRQIRTSLRLCGPIFLAL
jgi:hypothetical protein